MKSVAETTTPGSAVKAQLPGSLHRLGVLCGLAAGAWLGAAEAPTKLVTVGFSPFVISLGMVMGVFVARWTVPMALKGTSFVMADLRAKPHLIVWAILAGMLWAVANTLTVFAIRDVGLSVAFPLWNTNSLVGLFWGWLLFNELRGATARDWSKVLGGEENGPGSNPKRHWWEGLVFLGAIGIFLVLATGATGQQLAFSLPWMALLAAVSLALLVIGGVALWRRTRFT